MTLDRERLAFIADWEAAAVAASLPWSTTATSILIVLWLLTLIPTLDVATVRREVATAAGGLPVLLWLLAAVGMLWADVSWSERFGGLDSFHRLLMIPLLLAQFRRSGNGTWVIYGFFAGAVALLLASWILALVQFRLHGFHRLFDVPVKDAISQSTIFLICAFALLWRVCDLLRERNWRTAALLAGLVLLFLANIVFVATSRADLVVAPLLAVLLGWRQFRWKGILIACIAAGILAAGSWAGSPFLRLRLISVVRNVQDYSSSHVHNDVGDHIEFLKKSMTFVRDAPVIGHGTGSIAEQFRRSAAGETGAAAVATVNPHNQIFAVAIQLGLVGAAILVAMWAAHLLLFCGAGFTAWIGAVAVVQNIVSSLSSSHLFDFTHGWLYVFAVGVVGGMALRGTAGGADTSREDTVI